MKLNLKSIFIIIFTLILIKICITGFFGYSHLRQTQLTQDGLFIAHVVHTSISLKDSDNSSDTSDFIKNFNSMRLNKRVGHYIKMSLTKKRPTKGVYLPAKKISDAHFEQYRMQLYKTDRLSFYAYYPNHQYYVLYHIKTPINDSWLIYISLLLLGFILVLLGSGLVFFYNSKILPQDILNSLKFTPSKINNKGIQVLRQKIEEFYDEKNLMISALSHDIRTPLTEAMLKLELLENQKDAASIRKNLENINQIVKSSLDYSQTKESIDRKPVNLSSFLEQVCEDYNTKTFQVIFKTSNSSISANIDIPFFRRLIQNILNNARNYADKATILLSIKDTVITLTIKDNGPGVPPEALEKIGTPYYRVDKSRSKDTGGTGLGLAIVKNIVDMHDGSVSFKNHTNGGFKVIIHLPGI